MTNHLPSFSTIDPKNFVNQLDSLLQSNLDQINALLKQHHEFTWDNLMQPMEDMDDALERFWSPLSHLHAVVNSNELRTCYQACLPKLSAYEAAIGHNQALYDAIKSLDNNALDNVQQKIVDDTIRDFELSGVALSKEKKERFEAIQTRLSALSNQFENNVLDATQAFSIHITDDSALNGLPEHAVNTAAELAAEKDLTGWVFNLEFPCYLAVVTYAEDRAFREEMYRAYVTRASDEGPFADKFDNSAVIDEMLALRHEKALLLGFNNYAELSLATKMAESTTEVRHFLKDLASRAHKQAKHEFEKLKEFALTNYGLKDVAPWDVAYLSEKKRQARYAISQEDLRPYFPQPKVMNGLFAIVKKLYGMHLEEIKPVDVWHPDVKCYQVSDETDQIRGYIYVDLFARPHKRGGAWMDSLQSRRKRNGGGVQLPIATLTCNFAKPSVNKKATLSHEEVLTLFHEFGHCLHHILTQVNYLSASGINGVEWDAVELPSQFFENWCWEEEALIPLSEHVTTGEALPYDLFAKLIAAKNFQSAMAMMRQLEFSLFDFRIHEEFTKQPNFVSNILAEVREQTTVVPIVKFNRFQHSFSHIFGGGYAAGYYSYKWAEVLSSDAFARFEEEGIFNEQTGRDFLHAILEVGGSKKAADAYQEFRGRPANIDALLRHNGIVS
ncbi:oligopeptidase A [Legionella lansingensis]|uniref:oligopeptidase A n=1 Tax=Legionella lansingensis TaxID=45067 RepID=A0A0W0VLJ6_9GAMM|nr:M3 family metallopeptidase [Legionella lansingensis]KTD20964.1 oligopeptidase A [Legionella lansingensis]SNV44591.1 oligopeptidase A [Legionella lansingensis]